MHQVCFVAGPQVVTEVEGDDAGELFERPDGAGSIALSRSVVKRKLPYITQSIERLIQGGVLIARDQNDPDGPLVRCRILRTYRRTACHLQIVTIRDSAGVEQVLKTTDEHRFHVNLKGWVHAEDLVLGDILQEPGLEDSAVLSSVREEHPVGVTVYNLEVEGAHTYFVCAEGSDAEPVWVHNADDYGQIIDEGGGHSWKDHGPHTNTLQEARLRTGIAPSGRPAPTDTAGAFASEDLHLSAYDEAEKLLWTAPNPIKSNGIAFKQQVDLTFDLPGAGTSYSLDPSGNLAATPANRVKAIWRLNPSQTEYYLHTMYPVV